jgi:hypothetical protein
LPIWPSRTLWRFADQNRAIVEANRTVEAELRKTGYAMFVPKFPDTKSFVIKLKAADVLRWMFLGIAALLLIYSIGRLSGWFPDPLRRQPFIPALP